MNAVAGRDRSFSVVLLCFLLSGFAALIYQTAWTRSLSFVFGTSELAVATVLAAYMAGLSAGSAVAARLADRVRRPVLVYGLLEAGIAASALAVPACIRLTTRLQVALFGGSPGLPEAEGGGSALFFLLASFAVLALPTGFMGATLPLLARQAAPTERQIGPRVGLLYAVNTLGAIAGTLGAAFALLPLLGLRGTLYAAAGVNAVVFLLAVVLSRRLPAPDAHASRPGRASFSFVLPAVLLSGAVSFTYEVLWTRLLSHLLGGSVHAFAVMLAAFLTGITAGSAAAAALAREPASSLRRFGLCQLGVAATGVAAYALADRLPELAGGLEAALGSRTAADAALGVVVLLPATLFIGATFPFAVRVLAGSAAEVGGATGRVYAWNTVGAIAGALGAGFWLIPAAGFAGTVRLAAAASLLLALGAGLLAPVPGRWLRPAAVLGLVLLLLHRPDPPFTLLRTGALERRPAEGKAVFYAVGRSATVLVLDEGNQWSLRTNGLPEATIQGPDGRPGKYLADRWMGLLPSLLRPEARSLLAVGLGGGVALELVPSALREIAAVELEPEVVAANRHLSGLRARDPLSDPRLRVRINDARAALSLTSRSFDAIVSQPSHPWTAGASHLYTREFFRIVADRLAPGGVFVQWMGLGFVDAELLRVLLATLLDTFAHVRLYQPSASGLVLLAASSAPFGPPPDPAALPPDDARMLAALGVYTAEDLAAARLLDTEGARSFAAGAPVSTDDRNLLQMRSPSVLGRGLTPAALPRLVGELDAWGGGDLPGELDGEWLVRGLLRQGFPSRADRLAAALPSAGARHVARGLIADYLGDPARAGTHYEAALRAPGARHARELLFALRGRALASRPEALRRRFAPLRPDEETLLRAWAAERAGDLEALRALEAGLARVPPGDALQEEALRLRALHRLGSGIPAACREALPLYDQLLAIRGRPVDFLRRARAAACAGNASEAVETVAQLAAFVPSRPDIRGVAREALAFLRSLEVPAEDAGFRDRVEGELVRALGRGGEPAAGRRR